MLCVQIKQYFCLEFGSFKKTQKTKKKQHQMKML